MTIPVVLSGGSGTRLWPLSRQFYPKQMLSLVDEHSMLQNTVLRLSGMDHMEAPIVICNESHRFMVAEQLREIGCRPASIILEPVGRNTAPAVTVAALKALELADDPALLILPADHHIDDIAGFHRALDAATRFSRQEYLMTFGIVPQSPETGYGYIRKGTSLAEGGYAAFTIECFVEKPDLPTAQAYIASQNYLWNSGMFMFKASRVLRELQTWVPEMAAACQAALQKSTVDLDFVRLDETAFSACPSDSIDYAVMEKTHAGAMVPLDAGWNDLGSWEALWKTGVKQEHGNVLRGDVLLHDVHNSYLQANHRLLAAVGLTDHVVVETADAVFISPRDRVQDVKPLVSQLKLQRRAEALFHRRSYRPWGTCETIDTAERFQVKRITVKPGAKISLQLHFNRSEHWIVVRGTARVIRGEETRLLREAESMFIPAGVKHRLENPGKILLELIEVRTGSYLAEDDIVRYEDDYGRYTTT